MKCKNGWTYQLVTRKYNFNWMELLVNFVCMKNWSDYSNRITITLLETSRNLINGHSPISLLHLSFNSYLEVIISGRQHKRRDHFKTQKEPNQVICSSSYPALCDKGYQFLVVLSEVFVLRSYVLDGYNIIH